MYCKAKPGKHAFGVRRGMGVALLGGVAALGLPWQAIAQDSQAYPYTKPPIVNWEAAPTAPVVSPAPAPAAAKPAAPAPAVAEPKPAAAPAPAQAAPEPTVAPKPAPAAPVPAAAPPKPPAPAPVPSVAPPPAAAPVPAAPAVVPVATPPFGEATRRLLDFQVNGEAPGTFQPILGAEASRSYKRYLNSFSQPIQQPSARTGAYGGALSTLSTMMGGGNTYGGMQ